MAAAANIVYFQEPVHTPTPTPTLTPTPRTVGVHLRALTYPADMTRFGKRDFTYRPPTRVLLLRPENIQV